MSDGGRATLRQRAEGAVSIAAAREMSDTRWNALRRRVPRRVLAGSFVVVSAAALPAWWIAGSWALLLCPVWIAVFYLLRRAVRLQADLPDEHLDERQVAQRDRVYLHAYQAFAAVLLVLLFLVSVRSDRRPLGYEETSGLLWFALGLALGLPSAVLAWTVTEDLDSW